MYTKRHYFREKILDNQEHKNMFWVMFEPFPPELWDGLERLCGRCRGRGGDSGAYTPTGAADWGRSHIGEVQILHRKLEIFGLLLV